MAQRNGVITLSAFIKKYFFKLGIDEGEFHRYYVIGADGLRDLHVHHLPIMKTATLSIDGTNFTADYPDDYIDYVFVAIEDEDKGRWWTFTRDDEMVDKTISGITGSDLGELAHVIGPGGVGGHNKYYFQPDNHNRRFLFDEAYSGETVILKYKSTGVESVSYSSTDDVEFPVYAEDPMEKYLRWMLAEYDGEPISEKDRRKRLYESSVMQMRNLDLPSAQEILDIWLGSSNVTGVIRS